MTSLFSKTFYMGTTLMRPDARQHVWAIYAWCRRTDDLVVDLPLFEIESVPSQLFQDSPRALLNKDMLQRDLNVWTDRLDKIWRDEPEDLFDLAMADTVKVYPDLPIEPFRDMIVRLPSSCLSPLITVCSS